MRLLMFHYDSQAKPGVLQGNRVIDLERLVGGGEWGTPSDLLGVIDRGPDFVQHIRQSLESGPKGELLLNEVEVLAPLSPPRGNVLCIGRNYQEHAAESARARGEEVQRPTIFTKAQTSINGPYDDIPLHQAITAQVDWEVELGVVLGRQALNVPTDQALDYVFGYVVVNDVSARDIQYGWGGQFFKGKSLDGFCPIGPWIVTLDEIPDPQNLRLTLSVNGTQQQDANTRDMIFPVRDLITQLSLGMTLPVGTLIATGTPAGVAHGRDPEEFLHVNDVVEATGEGIGTLQNRMIGLD